MVLFYSVFGVIIEKIWGVEDDFNIVVVGIMIGMLYKCIGGFWGIVWGGLIGLIFISFYVLYNNWEYMKGFLF